MQREFQDEPKAKRARLVRTDQANRKLAIFVHGYQPMEIIAPGYLGTWAAIVDNLRQLESPKSPRAYLNQWDFLFVGYSTSGISTYLDIVDIIKTQWTLSLDEKKYTRFALIGHSLGCLGIRQLLCAWTEQPANFTKALKSVLLFAPPQAGSTIGRLLPIYRINAALTPGNPQLRMLHTWSKCAHPRQQPWPPIVVVRATQDWVVGHAFDPLMEWGGDAEVCTVNAGHLNVKTPANWRFSQAEEFLRKVLK